MVQKDANMEYVYVRENHTTKVIYDFDKFNWIKAIYENDAQTGLFVLYDGNDTLYDLQVESVQRGGGANLLLALIDFCFAIRETEKVEIHLIRGEISPLDNDKNREIYRMIYEKMKDEINSSIEMRYYYNSNHKELPLDDAAFLSKYERKVRYLEFILP